MGEMAYVQRPQTLEIMLDDGAYMPVRAHEDDAGLDLRSPIGFTIGGHSTVALDTGVHVRIPRGWFGKLESKSGLNIKHEILCPGGVIDSGYTGSVVAKLYNLGPSPYEVKAGDKVVQMVLQPCATPDLIVVESFDETERGEGGFGSSGR